MLHHAIVQVVEPELERVAIHDSYACRRGKGLHKAIARAQACCRRHPFYVQLDVRRFFDSVDHSVLRRGLARRFKDRALLRLFSTMQRCSDVTNVARIPLTHALAVGCGLGLPGIWWGDEPDSFAKIVWARALFRAGRWKTRRV